MNRRAGLGALTGCLLLAACVPWTVRPIQQAEAGPFDPARYADSIWRSKVLPVVSASAVDLAQLLAVAPPFSKPVLVKGEGKVVRVDETSRSGLLLLDLAPFDGRPDAALQIGPVIRGTVLRDALPFIQFSQFVNQLDYARAGGALNERALKSALAGVSAAGLAGAIVGFSGAAEPASGGRPPEIVPLTLTVKRGAL
ncbi:MAG: DUF2291 domain-containing protein [Candidatus Solibacter sp.]|nr:DUF2291 domain-containing protein [Candidatus Solibacter sp.]